MFGTIIGYLLAGALAAYCVGIFVYDHRKRKSGAPSIFLDQCESEGHGKRLVKAYHKKYGKKTLNLHE